MSSSQLPQANSRLRQERIQRNWRQRDLAELLGTTVITITRWERGSHQPSAYFRVKLCAIFGKTVEELGLLPEVASASQKLEEIASDGHEKATPFALDAARPWGVPFPRNPFFTGREEVLATLHSQLAQACSLALTQAPALAGFGGIGKTQVAVEYAYRYTDDYNAVFWLAAETPESLIRSLHQIAEQVQLPQSHAAEQKQMIAAVQRWLVSHPGWLLICDNVEDPDLLQTVLPIVTHSALLITTRLQALGALANPLALSPMNSQEGVSLILRRAKRLSLPDSGNALSSEIVQDSSTFTPAAVELVKLLGGLPLALDQAGAYLEETGCSVEDYLRRCYDQRKQILAHRGLHGGIHPASVTSTLSLSIERVEREHPAAVELLRLCAFLHPEAIPEELITSNASLLEPILGTVVTDLYQFDLALAALRRVSLITRSPVTQTLSMHRLVQAVLQDQMEPAEALLWGDRTLQMLKAAFPDVSYETWEQCERLSAHVVACFQHTSNTSMPLEFMALACKMAEYLKQRGNYKEAESFVQRALAVQENIPDREPLAEADILYRLADLLRLRGRYAEAEPLYQRALPLQEQILGPEHLTVARSLRGFANLCFHQGRYAEAELFDRRVLSIQEHILGPEHADVGFSLYSLAECSVQQGKQAEAEALYLRSLHIQECALGSEHPDIAIVLNGLAILLFEQGRDEEAEHFFLRALSLRENTLGPGHPAVAASLNNLADFLFSQGRYAEVEPLLQRALAIWEQALGPEHANIPYALDTLADLHFRQDRLPEAESLSVRAAHIWEQAFGPNHHLLSLPLHRLARIYTQQGKYEEARLLYQRVLVLKERQGGVDSLEVVPILSQLASLYGQQGQSGRAISLYQRALAIVEAQSGPTDVKTQELRQSYEDMLQRARKAR